MEDILLFIVIIPFFIAGYYAVKKVDLFLEENQNKNKDSQELKEANSVLLSSDSSIIEIAREIERFKEKHKYFEIILRDGKQINDIIDKEDPGRR